jgi:tRNA threonylcarbamoyl adenosine modification protein YjeE
LAQKIARFIEPGDTLLLQGDLGAGKSHFARSFIQAMGTKQSHIPSPTFTLVQAYDDTRLPLIHADLYRLKDASELDDLDMHDYFGHGVCLIEWPERAAKALPQTALTLHFTVTGEDTRKVELLGDARWQKRLKLMLQPADTSRAEKDFAGFLAKHGFAGAEVVSVSGDASFRRYFRVKAGNRSAIMMDVPAVLQDNESGLEGVIKPFLKMNEYLHKAGLRVSEIYGVDEKQCLILHEDFGDTSLYSHSPKKCDPAWLQVAVEALIQIARAKPLTTLKPFDAALMNRSVSLYTDWYLPTQRGHATAPDERARFLEAWAQVYKPMVSSPLGVQLRDYHSPNIMLLGQVPSLNNLGLIDYQDATYGPLAYDLVSVLYDARLPVDECTRRDLLEHYMVKTGVDAKAFETSFYLLSLMRNTRILGVFVRLAQRDGKRNYLEKIPILLPYIQEALQHPAAAPVRPWLQKVESIAA